jgi:hypothetical protein
MTPPRAAMITEVAVQLVLARVSFSRNFIAMPCIIQFSAYNFEIEGFSGTFLHLFNGLSKQIMLVYCPNSSGHSIVGICFSICINKSTFNQYQFQAEVEAILLFSKL